MPSDIKHGYRNSVWDDSEPEYAPGLKTIHGKYRWAPARKYVLAGYSNKTYILGAPDDGDDLPRAAQCRAYTREMILWYENRYQGREAGTWGWLIGRFKSDETSQITRVTPTTRAGYLKVLNRMENAIGEVKIDDTDYDRMMGWVNNMEKNGRSDGYIAKWFTHFMFVVGHGIKLEVDRCSKIKEIRGAMRLGSGNERLEFITRPQYEALLQASDDAGTNLLSLAMMLRFETGLRGTDVYGEWEPLEGRSEGIIDNGRRWDHGLEWAHFDRDITTLTKVPSKTRKKLKRPLVFDLTQTPDLRARLISARGDRIAGPVLVYGSTQLPPRARHYQDRFRQIADGLGMEGLQLRDLRSGAATEADMLGADRTGIQKMMGHSNAQTTQRYMRDNSIDTVVELRQKGRE